MIDLKIDTKQIDDFAKRLQNKADSMTKEINATLNNWGSDVIVYARQNHRFKSHSPAMLEKSVSKRMATSGTPKIFLYLDSKVAMYGKFIHDGTKDHIVKPKAKKALRYPNGGQFGFSKGHKVSGIKADNFLERAIDHLKPKLASDLKAELKKRI